jgi:hypothetical protein
LLAEFKTCKMWTVEREREREYVCMRERERERDNTGQLFAERVSCGKQASFLIYSDRSV